MKPVGKNDATPLLRGAPSLKGRGPDGVRLRPGREVRDGVTCYDGTGPSGYTGRCSRPGLVGTLLGGPRVVSRSVWATAPRKRRRTRTKKKESK